MTCPLPEESLALYVEGDLPPDAAVQVERHLRTCAICTDTADALRESVSTIRQLRAYGVGASDVSDVRRRVLQATAMESPGWALGLERALVTGFRRRYALASVTAAVLICAAAGLASWYLRGAPHASGGAAVLAPGPAPEMPVTIAPAPAAEQTSSAPVETVPHARRPVQRVAHAATRPEREPQDLMVKLFTDDPNIVVYWLVEQNGAVQ